MLAEDIAPTWTTQTPHGPVTFWCPGRWPYSRSDMQKEPATYDWLESLERDAVFWDIGANVGVYSLYAAARGMTVCAFEPEASNFHVLTRNISLNGDRVTALNVGISEGTGLARLTVGSASIGGAQHQVGKNGSRAVLTFACRDLVSSLGLPEPNHVKIDVDGHELSVVRGMDLASPSLRSVQIELRGGRAAALVAEAFAAAGFTASRDISALTGVANVIYRKT